MKNQLSRFLSVVLFLFLNAIPFFSSAQNTFDMLYNLNAGSEYPNDMPKVKKWIDKTIKPIFISSLQRSDSQRGDNVFLSFSLMGKNSLDIALANTGGMSLKFANAYPPKFKSQQIRLVFTQELKAYTGRITADDFGHDSESYFDLACTVMRLDNSQIISNTFNYMVRDLKKGEDKAQIMASDINAKMKTSLVVSNTENDRYRIFLSDFEKMFPKSKTRKAIYETYIKGKNDKQTNENLNHFFRVIGFFNDGGVGPRLEKMFNPSFKLSMNKAEALVFPASVLYPVKGSTIDSLVRFEYSNMESTLDYQNHQLILRFLGKLNQPSGGNFKQYILNPRTGKTVLGLSKKVPEKGYEFTKMELTIAESGIILSAYTVDETYFELMKNAWPSDWLSKK